MLSPAFPTLLKVSLKTYYRNRQAIFFSLFFPLVIMVIFGLLNLGGTPNVDIGLVDQAHNPVSAGLASALKGYKAITLHEGAQAQELAQLDAGKRDLVAVLPPGFGTFSAPGKPAAATITAYLNQGRQAQSQVSLAIMEQLASNVSFRVSGLSQPYTVAAKEQQGKNLTYVDFLVPGIIGYSVMSTGVFSLAFGLVRLKETGILRRLIATPMRRGDFLTAQVVTRVIMSVIQVVILIAVATLVFKFKLHGNFLYLVVSAGLGATVFIALGFIIAGVSRNEDSVPAIANIVTLPMMFLSGVFFSVDSVPAWLRVISDRLPLTYLNDSLRSISVDGASLWAVRWDFLWMGVWLVALAVLAVRSFRWESRA